MRMHGLAAVVGAALAAAALLPGAAPASAEVGGGYDPDGGGPQTTTEVTVTSTPQGVTIYIESEQVTPGTEGGEGSGGGSSGSEGSGPSCQATPVNLAHTSTEWLAEGLREHPGTYPWGVSCDDGAFGIAWVPTDASGSLDIVSGEPPPPPIDPEVVRDAVFEIVPLPGISVGANPSVGLVAVESWFWVQGYSGGTLRGSASLQGSHVDVEITPVRYRWSWGDGGSLTTSSRGLAYPRESTIRHTYERSSLTAGGSYRVSLQIDWEARYSENGGAWLVLDPITSGHRLSYAVRQLQSVLTASR